MCLVETEVGDIFVLTNGVGVAIGQHNTILRDIIYGEIVLDLYNSLLDECL